MSLCTSFHCDQAKLLIPVSVVPDNGSPELPRSHQPAHGGPEFGLTQALTELVIQEQARQEIRGRGAIARLQSHRSELAEALKGDSIGLLVARIPDYPAG